MSKMSVAEAIERGIIEECGLVCPYCGSELSESWSTCCGEAGHGEPGYSVEHLDYLVTKAELRQALNDRARFLIELERAKVYRNG